MRSARATDNPFKTIDPSNLSRPRRLRGMGIAGRRRSSVEDSVLRSFSFEIQPAATFKKPNLGDRLHSLFFAPMIMSERALRVPTLRKASFDERPSDLARGLTITRFGSARESSDRPVPKHENLAARPTDLRKGCTAHLPNSSVASVLTKDAALPPSQSEQRECESSPAGRSRVSSYKLHSISTKQLSNGHWVATIARLDGAPIVVNGLSCVSLTTSAYLADFLAIADAEIEIDEIVTGGD